MTLSAVMNQVHFASTVDSSEQSTLTAAIGTLYNGSATARQMFDYLVSKSVMLTLRADSTIGSQAVVGGYDVNINFNDVANLKYLTAAGTVENFTVERILGHEMGHAFLSLSDNAPGDYVTAAQDYIGQTVPLENQIMRELGQYG